MARHRSHSFTIIDQKYDPTCILHSLSRSGVRNIFQPDVCSLVYHGQVIPPYVGDMTSTCMEYLPIYPASFDISRLNPESCGGVRPYFSTLMYVYIYYSLLENYREVSYEPISSGYQELVTILQVYIDSNIIPSLLRSKQDDILLMLQGQQIYLTHFDVQFTKKQSRDPFTFNGLEDKRCLDFLKTCFKRGVYVVAASEPKKGDGHSLILSGIDKKYNVEIKNSYGVPIDTIPLSELASHNYKLTQLVPFMTYEEQYEHGIDEDDTLYEETKKYHHRPINHLWYISSVPYEELQIRRMPSRRVGTVRKGPVKSSATRRSKLR